MKAYDATVLAPGSNRPDDFRWSMFIEGCKIRKAWVQRGAAKRIDSRKAMHALYLRPRCVRSKLANLSARFSA